MVETPESPRSRSEKVGNGDHRWKMVVLRRRLRKVEGSAKATGKAIYTDDIMLPGMLHAKILRSPHAHAKIRNIDFTEAEKLPGVRGNLNRNRIARSVWYHSVDPR